MMRRRNASRAFSYCAMSRISESATLFILDSVSFCQDFNWVRGHASRTLPNLQSGQRAIGGDDVGVRFVHPPVQPARDPLRQVEILLLHRPRAVVARTAFVNKYNLRAGEPQ